MAGTKRLRIGLDFDGVVAYNPLRVARKPVTEFKKLILGKKKKEFIIPKNRVMRWLWTLAHETSLFPGIDPKYLQILAKRKNIELYLITARYSFLDQNLNKWLIRHSLAHIFKKINLNKNDEQPHEYKLKIINSLSLDYFIEDNWDIVEFLTGKTKTQILWLTNILDYNQKYSLKFNRLIQALDWIANSNKVRIPKNT